MCSALHAHHLPILKGAEKEGGLPAPGSYTDMPSAPQPVGRDSLINPPALTPCLLLCCLPSPYLGIAFQFLPKTCLWERVNSEKCQNSLAVLSCNSIFTAAYVGRNVILTSGCIIGACCNLNTFEVIPENTVIYGADCLRRVQTERPQVLGPLANEGVHPGPLIFPESLRLPQWAPDDQGLGAGLSGLISTQGPGLHSQRQMNKTLEKQSPNLDLFASQSGSLY